MTLRMNFACVAMAASALIMADVAAAPAAMRSCNAEPWRCRYASDGRQYFHAYGARESASTVTGAGNAAGAGAWGCGATDGVATGRSWGFANQAAASSRALAGCKKYSTQGSCRVVSCSPAVKTYADAHAAWFSKP